MTDAELDAIEQRLEVSSSHDEMAMWAYDHGEALVAEVRRLRAAYELQQFPQKVSPYVRETGAEIDPL